MTIRPHWINAWYQSDKPDRLHYDDEPHYEEWQAAEAAREGDGMGSFDRTYRYSHTVCVRPGAHGKLVTEVVQFDVRPGPAPRSTIPAYSWG